MDADMRSDEDEIALPRKKVRIQLGDHHAVVAKLKPLNKSILKKTNVVSQQPPDARHNFVA